MNLSALMGRGAGWLGLCALVLGLQGCPARPGRVDGALHDGVATGMHRNALMDAAFGANQQKISPQEVFWQADLPLPRVQAADEPPRSAASAAASAAPALRLGEEQVTPVLVRPREVIKLNETELAVVVESMSPDVAERAATVASSAAAGNGPVALAPLYVGVVFFSRENAKENDEKNAPAAESWRARRLIPAVDVLPAQAEPADTQVYKIGSDQYLMTYTQHRCHSGVCRRDLKGYLLAPDEMTGALATRLSGSNANAHADCPARLGEGAHPSAALVAATTQENASAQTPTPAATRKPGKSAHATASAAHACYAIHGEVHPISREMASADVSLRFDGVASDALGQRHAITQSQLFRLQGKQFVQIEGGANPVPEGF